MNKYLQTNGTLINQFNTENIVDLDYSEVTLSFLEATEINFTSKLVEMDPFSEETFKWIHKQLFQECYAWAGEYREANITKGEIEFPPFEKVREEVKIIFSSDSSTFADVAKMYIDLNSLHPFMKGNGRTTRVWLNAACRKVLNKEINFMKVSPKIHEEIMSVVDLDKFIDEYEPTLTTINSVDYIFNQLNQYQSFKYDGYDLMSNKYHSIYENSNYESLQGDLGSSILLTKQHEAKKLQGSRHEDFSKIEDYRTFMREIIGSSFWTKSDGKVFKNILNEGDVVIKSWTKYSKGLKVDNREYFVFDADDVLVTLIENDVAKSLNDLYPDNHKSIVKLDVVTMKPHDFKVSDIIGHHKKEIVANLKDKVKKLEDKGMLYVFNIRFP